ncbi:type IV pilin protein [Synechococcus sp. MIT S9451]|uniref:type IV pilin protein n=1 Tax=Synechococcus sp. MIT S9451 TaxID=3082543 RepID=UPI0039B3D057
MKNNIPNPSEGFTLLELLIVIVIVSLASAWALPQYHRRRALSQLDQYTQQIESGLFNLRARQSAEGTSCEINFNPAFVGTDNVNSGFGSATDVIETSHLTQQQRDQRLQCCDATGCSWDPPYRLISREGTANSKLIELKASKAQYSLSPPGTSTDESPLLVVIRSTNWNKDPQRPLPLRCVKLSTTGHLHRGTWENNRCRRR